jgi:hypothetical protein
LTEFKHREPFVPFVVEMHDGRLMVADNKCVLIKPPSTGFITLAGELVMFECDEVRDIQILGRAGTA